MVNVIHEIVPCPGLCFVGGLVFDSWFKILLVIVLFRFVSVLDHMYSLGWCSNAHLKTASLFSIIWSNLEWSPCCLSDLGDFGSHTWSDSHKYWDLGCVGRILQRRYWQPVFIVGVSQREKKGQVLPTLSGYWEDYSQHLDASWLEAGPSGSSWKLGSQTLSRKKLGDSVFIYSFWAESGCIGMNSASVRFKPVLFAIILLDFWMQGLLTF